MREIDFSKIKGFLIDLDGVLYVDKKPIRGSLEAVEYLKKRISVRFLTNTTTKTSKDLYVELRHMGFEIEQDEIITPIEITGDFIKSRGYKSVYLVMHDALKADFSQWEQSDAPDCIVIGDIGHRWDYKLLNDLFRKVLNGADLVALHKGRFWRKLEGQFLDIGAFIAAIEYSANKEAYIMGKPSAIFFETAIRQLTLKRNEVCMIGDDIISDIGGGQDAGIKGILVKTGKYDAEYVSATGILPDLTIKNLFALTDLI